MLILHSVINTDKRTLIAKFLSGKICDPNDKFLTNKIEFPTTKERGVEDPIAVKCSWNILI